MLKLLIGSAIAAVLVLAFAMRPIEPTVSRSVVGWSAYPHGYQSRIDKAIEEQDCRYLEQERRDAAGVSDRSSEPALSKYIREGMKSAAC